MTGYFGAAAERATKSGGKPGISFLKLRDGRCRFPLGEAAEPALRFCGAETQPPSPYCSECRRIAYVSSAKR